MGRCRHCGSETGEGELFCANCGARLEEENPETGAAAETEEAEQEQATEPVAREAAASKAPVQEEAAAEKKDASAHRETAESAAGDRTSGA